MKSVGENEAKRFDFVLTMWPQGKVKVNESGIEWYLSMVAGNVKVSESGIKW